MMLAALSWLALATAIRTPAAAPNTPPRKIVNVSNSAVRYDTDGNIVNSHSGNLVFVNGTYFLYGEYYGHAHFTSDGTVHHQNQRPLPAIDSLLPRLSVYTSSDMVQWSFKGLLHNNSGDTSRWWANSGHWPGGATDSGQWWCPAAVYSKARRKMLIWFTAVPGQCCEAFWGVAESSDGVHFDLITLNETGVASYMGTAPSHTATANANANVLGRHAAAKHRWPAAAGPGPSPVANGRPSRGPRTATRCWSTTTASATSRTRA